MLVEENKWEEGYKVHSFLTDRYCRLSIPAVSRLFQETAEAHTNVYNMGYHSMISNRKAWVLLRVYYQVYDYPKIYTNMTVRTWSRGYRGVTALRDFQMMDDTGRVVIAGSSTWCIIDMDKRSPQRCDKILESFPQSNDAATELDVLPKLKPESDDGYVLLKTIKVPLMAIDKAQHTNNAMYMSWIMDSLDKDDQARKLKTVDISYVHETEMDDNLQIFLCKPDRNTYKFKMINSLGLSMLCNIELE